MPISGIPTYLTGRKNTQIILSILCVLWSRLLLFVCPNGDESNGLRHHLCITGALQESCFSLIDCEWCSFSTPSLTCWLVQCVLAFLSVSGLVISLTLSSVCPGHRSTCVCQGEHHFLEEFPRLLPGRLEKSPWITTTCSHYRTSSLIYCEGRIHRFWKKETLFFTLILHVILHI